MSCSVLPHCKLRSCCPVPPTSFGVNSRSLILLTMLCTSGHFLKILMRCKISLTKGYRDCITSAPCMYEEKMPPDDSWYRCVGFFQLHMPRPLLFAFTSDVGIRSVIIPNVKQHLIHQNLLLQLLQSVHCEQIPLHRIQSVSGPSLLILIQWPITTRCFIKNLLNSVLF